MAQKILFKYYNSFIVPSGTGGIKLLSLNSLTKDILMDIYVSIRVNDINYNYTSYIYINPNSANELVNTCIILHKDILITTELMDNYTNLGFKEKTFKISNILLKKSILSSEQNLCLKIDQDTHTSNIIKISAIGIGFEEDLV